jgi:LysM repeat protein
MPDETIEQSVTKKTTLELRNKAVEQYQNAFRAAIEIRADFSRKYDYLLEEQPDEQESHKAIAAFGDFYNASNIARLQPTDYQRLQEVNGDLESAKDSVLRSFDKRGFAFKRLAKVEAAVEAEFEDQKLVNKLEVPIEEKSHETREASKAMQENTPKKESSPTTSISSSTAEEKAENKLGTLPANQADVALEEILISQFATNQDSPLDWVKAQNEKTISNMRHMMVLSFLQEQQFSAEREHFYNEVHKHFGRQIESVGDAEQYIAKLMNSRESDTLLRDTAPGALAATKEYINGIDLDASLHGAGYPLNLVTPEFREKMMITQAYANRIGGDEGSKSFLKALADQKENFVKGLGDQRVGLAISGSMLAMSVMAGTGPAGLVIGSLKVAQKLLDTEKGKAFQKALYSSAVSFMEKLGVKPEVVDAVTESVKNIWSKSIGSKWGKVAMYGAAVCAIVTLAPSAPFASENIITSAHSSVPTPTSSLPDITESMSAPQATPSVPDIKALDAESNGFGSGEEITQSVDAAYDIKSGDNLWNIAKEAYGQAHPGQTPNNIQLINMVNEIAEHNHIDNPNMIYSGQTIQIPQNLEPSSELVSGPTNWLKDQSSNMISRLEGLNDRTQEWRQEHKLDSQASLPKGSIRV